MKNKIFNAIQKGVQNALVFDDNETSISYQKSDINNKTEYFISFEDLYDIFKKQPEDIFNQHNTGNTKDSISLILDNGQEISLHEYKNSDIPVFLKITNDSLKNFSNEIIIACNNSHLISYEDWQSEYEQSYTVKYPINTAQEAFNDFNGYKKCQTILKNIKNKRHIPAIEYCDIIKSPLDNYKGYLPSMGQLKFILKYLDIINYIFEYINIEILKLNFDKWWTVSENSYYLAWHLSYKEAITDGKTYKFKVLPLFIKKIND